MADLVFKCPHCARTIAREEDLIERIVECPTCKGEIIVPSRDGKRPPPKFAIFEEPVAAGPIPSPAPAAFSPVASHPGPEEETDLFVLTPSAKAFLGEILLGLLLFIVIIGMFMLISVWIRIKSLQYRLTTQRLFVRRGLIAKHLEEVELFRIKDVTVDQTVLQRILGVGTVSVLSSDDSNPKIDLIGLDNPHEIKELIRNQYRIARRREGFRTSEFINS